jgi:hypothetical protein
MFIFFTYIIVLAVGFMMGTIYKQAFFHINVPKFDYKATRNIFWIIFLSAVSICSYLSFKTIDAFGQIGEAEERLYVFQEYEMMLTFTSNLAFIALVSLANLTSIASKNVRWILYGFVFVFYAGFTVVDNFLLADVMFEYKKLNQLWKGEFNLSTLKGFLSLFICLALCIFNAFMIRYSLKAK